MGFGWRGILWLKFSLHFSLLGRLKLRSLLLPPIFVQTNPWMHRYPSKSARCMNIVINKSPLLVEIQGAQRYRTIRGSVMVFHFKRGRSDLMIVYAVEEIIQINYSCMEMYFGSLKDIRLLQ